MKELKPETALTILNEVFMGCDTCAALFIGLIFIFFIDKPSLTDSGIEPRDRSLSHTHILYHLIVSRQEEMGWFELKHKPENFVIHWRVLRVKLFLWKELHKNNSIYSLER